MCHDAELVTFMIKENAYEGGAITLVEPVLKPASARKSQTRHLSLWWLTDKCHHHLQSLHDCHTQTDMVHEYLSNCRLCSTSLIHYTLHLFSIFITGCCLSFPSKCTSAPNFVPSRHSFLCASLSVNLHRNLNRTAGSRGVQKLPQCHCIINDFDNNTFIFILVPFSWSCGDFCQIIME